MVDSAGRGLPIRIVLGVQDLVEGQRDGAGAYSSPGR